MKEEKELLREIREARRDPRSTDRFIERYTPFIRSEVMRFAQDGNYSAREDEISVAMFAFYEALMNYDRNRGAFFPLAGTYIRNRLIDHFRQDPGRYALSLDEEIREGGSATLLDTVEDERSSADYQQARECTAEEIGEFREALSGYGLTLSDIADSSPRQKRTMALCMDALSYARAHREILDEMERTRKLPLSKLVRGGGFDRKTLERHRKYLIGIFLAFTNGFVIIRGHLCQMKEAADE